LTEPTPPSAPRRRLWRIVAAAVLLVLLAAAITIYAARRVIARDALTGWLRDQGIESEVTFQTFDPGGLSGALRIGPAAHPDLTAEVAEIHYDLLGFWNGRALGARVTEVRLVNPVLHARLHAAKVSLGSLDPLIEKLRRQPPKPDQGQPSILVEGGRLLLDTDYGVITASADAQLNHGRLQRLDARIDPAALKGRDLEARLGASELHVVGFGDRMAIAAAAQLDRARMTGLSAEGAALRLSVQAPYPDLIKQTANGDVSLNLTVTARALTQGALSARDIRQALRFKGAASGWLETLALKGSGDATLQAAQAKVAGSDGRAVQFRAQATDLTWTRAGGDRVGASLRLTGGADRWVASPDLILTQIAGVFEGPAAATARTWKLDLAGGASARGGWTGLGQASRGDLPGDAALKTALKSFLADAPKIALHASDTGVSLALAAPARLTADAGGQAVLSAGGGPLYADGAGAFRLITSGGALPVADLVVDRYRMGRNGVEGHARLNAKGSLGPVVGGGVDVAGGFRIADGGFALTAERCAPVSAARLELGANDVEAVSGELCPVGGALFHLGDGGWRVHGLAKGMAARVPFLEAQVSQVAGPVELSTRHGDLALTADIQAARLEDTARPLRFRPLLAHGSVVLANQVWRGGFSLTDPAGRALAQAKLDHDGRAGVGGVTFDTGILTFAEGGLQPAALSPLAAAIGAPATGRARFQGAIDWTAAEATSHGTLDVLRLDFRSPAGAVSGLSGQVVLSSLAPLRAAPGQTLRAEAISGLAPLKGAELSFGLDHEAIQVAGASFGLGGGKVSVKPFEVPFASGGAWNAEIDLDGVQLADLVEASPFADRMDLKARVSGHIPFSVGKAGVKINAGELHAIEPGRLTIRREALTQVASDGVAPVAQAKGTTVPLTAEADPYSDFVYQAMEDLAFTELSAEVNSLAGGRLGVLFHIKGEHAPPKQQTIQLSFREVLSRKITRKLPLPSGTKVDLTLDTSVNLDQLLGDFAEYQRLRGSGPIQP
jgi:hypothetical protein